MAEERNEQLVASFSESLWLESGLSDRSRLSYESDLRQFGRWLNQRYPGSDLTGVDRTCLMDYLSSVLSAGARSSTAARRLSCLRRFYRYLLREGVVDEDPTLRLDSPKLARRLPDTLTEADVEALLDAPADAGHDRFALLPGEPSAPVGVRQVRRQV